MIANPNIFISLENNHQNRVHLYNFIDAMWKKTHFGLGLFTSANYVIFGLDDGLSLIRYQAIIETNTSVKLIGPRAITSETVSSKFESFQWWKFMSKLRPFYLSHNVANMSEFFSERFGRYFHCLWLMMVSSRFLHYWPSVREIHG